MNQFEKYLKGVPLNEELAALKNGEMEQVHIHRAVEQSRVDHRELDDLDREHLRRLRVEPGWPIFLNLIDKDIKTQEDMVKDSSMDNPLGNRERIAEDWAYVAIMKRVRNRAVSLIDAEVKKLEVEQYRVATNAGGQL